MCCLNPFLVWLNYHVSHVWINFIPLYPYGALCSNGNNISVAPPKSNKDTENSQCLVETTGPTHIW